MTNETTGGRADNSPNERQRPPTHLCREHSSRPTQPSDCRDCDRRRREARRDRQINALEEQVRGMENTLEAYESQMAHLEERLDNLADDEKVTA